MVWDLCKKIMVNFQKKESKNIECTCKIWDACSEKALVKTPGRKEVKMGTDGCGVKIN